MQDDMKEAPAQGVVRIFPTAPNRANATLQEVADAFMGEYRGRDPARPGAVAFWVKALGAKRAADISADDIADVLERYASEPVTRYAGRDQAGNRVLRRFGKRKPATINRVRSVVSGLLTFAKKKRCMPPGWVNPCRDLQPEPLDNARTRFLTNDERARLLKVCRLSSWPRLYLIALMAITTGARRGELLALRYADLDLETGRAHVRTSKNGEQRVLPLTAEVLAEIKRHGKGAPQALLFASAACPDRPMRFAKAFNAAVAAAGVEDFHFHDLRHTCASLLAQNGASLLELADVLGHRTLQMVQRYAHLSVDSKRRLVERVMGGIG